MSPSLWLEKLNALAPAFIDAAVRGAVVLVIALVLTHLLRRRTAAARHLVWVGAIVVQLLLPLFAMWGPRWQLAIPERIASFLPVSLPTSAPATNGISDGAPSIGAPSGGVTAPAIEAAPAGARRRQQQLKEQVPREIYPRAKRRARDDKISPDARFSSRSGSSVQ